MLHKGAAVTWAATSADPDVPAVLVASDDGRPTYERMSDAALERWTAWLRPALGLTGSSARWDRWRVRRGERDQDHCHDRQRRDPQREVDQAGRQQRRGRDLQPPVARRPRPAVPEGEHDHQHPEKPESTSLYSTAHWSSSLWAAWVVTRAPGTDRA